MCPKVEAAVTFPLRSQRENFPMDVTCGASAAQTPLALMEHNRMWKISSFNFGTHSYGGRLQIMGNYSVLSVPTWWTFFIYKVPFSH